MKSNKKKKIYELAVKYVNSDNVKILLLFVPLTLLCIEYYKRGELTINEFMDTSILTSFILLFLFDAIARIIIRVVTKKTEDAVKLTEDYEKLVNKYNLDKKRMICVPETDLILPEIKLWSRKINEKYSITVNANSTGGSTNRYNLPKQLADNSTRLFNAHSYSTIYNNINIRLSDFQVESNNIALEYEFTTYFDSMITNRAMDYPFKENRTVREVYEPGPFLSELKESKLSNHIGFNGFVRLGDGKIIFVRRAENVSIGKGLWAQSIGAAMKTKYCLDDNGGLSGNGLFNAIVMEIRDELMIPTDINDDYKGEIIAFYRDIVEGGKPQFVFLYEEKNITSEDFLRNFNSRMKEKKTKKKVRQEVIIDGEEFAFLTIDDLRKCKLNIDSIEIPTDICNSKKYPPKMKMMPSSVASIILLLEAFEE